MKFLTAIATLILATATAVADATVTFDAGAEGWIGGVVEPTGGNPGALMRTVAEIADNVEYRTFVNPAFVGDYTSVGSVTLGIDLRVDVIHDAVGNQLSRPWSLELRNLDMPDPPFPFSSVWFVFGSVNEIATADWTHFEVTIDDTGVVDPPPGWTIFPETASFVEVLSSVGYVRFSTSAPDLSFVETEFDLSIDNISIVSGGGAQGPGESQTLTVGRTTTAGELVLEWSASCLAGATDYGIYEGEIGDWYDHSSVDCTDAGDDLTETRTPLPGDRYFLVVPLSDASEGSYGTSSQGDERPRGLATCRSEWNTQTCP